MQARTRLRSIMLGVLVWGFGGAGLTGACDSPPELGPPKACPAPPDIPTETSTECSMSMEDACFRYRIQLMGNPSADLELRKKYIGAFGDACYMSEGPTPTFNCFYKTPEEACEAGVLVAELYGAAPYDKSYPACEPIPGTENYYRQVGPDPAIHITISYEPAPRQSPLIEVDGVPTEVSGPYRDLPEPPTVGPGHEFNNCSSGMLAADGTSLLQHRYILEVNRKAHGGEIHSDLAGFKWTCEVYNANCEIVEAECEEPLVLHDRMGKPAPFDPGLFAEVNHVVPRKDQRSCDWGTNSNKNAAVISRALNQWLRNKNPPAEEIQRVNAAKAYTP